MKLWIDDVRQAPNGSEWVWLRSVAEVKSFIDRYYAQIDLIDIDHDAGDFVNSGGDYIRVLDYLESNHYDDIPIHIHSMNPVGVENMRRIICKNGWREI